MQYANQKFTVVLSLAIVTACSSAGSYEPNVDAQSANKTPAPHVLSPQTTLGVMALTRTYSAMQPILEQAKPLQKGSNGYRLTSATSIKSGGWRSVDAPLDVTLPSTLGEPIRLVDEIDPHIWLEVSAREVNHVEGELNENALVHRNAILNTDVIHVAEAGRVEELRLVYSAEAPNTARYHIKTGPGVSKVIVRSERVEVLDHDGHVRMMTEPMFLIDANGTRREVHVDVTNWPSKEDSNKEYQLTTKWNIQELQFPLVVDPKWTSGSLWPDKKSRVYFAATLTKKATNLIITGGKEVDSERGGDPTFSKSTLVYDLTKTGNKWSPMPLGTWIPRTGHSLIPINETSGVVLGGELDSANLELQKSVSLLNLDSLTWGTLASMSQRRVSPATVWLPTQNKVLVIGGEPVSKDEQLSSAEMYEIGKDVWSPAGTLKSYRRKGHTASLLKDGNVLVVGGYSGDDSSPLSSTEIFNTKTGAWTTMPSSTPRLGHRAVELLNGLVLVVGSDTNAGNLNTAELFSSNGSVATFGSASHAPVPLKDPYMIRLDNGQVLVFGGYECRNNMRFKVTCDSASQSTWIYTPSDTDFGSWKMLNNASLSSQHRDGAAFALPGGRAIVLGGLGETRIEIFEPELGGDCNAMKACEVGYCVNGKCCNTKCEGQCEICEAGICKAFDGDPQHKDKPACVSVGSEPCKQMSCHGSRDSKQCTYAGEEVPCGKNFCEKGTLNHKLQCNGQGQCVPTLKGCLPFVICDKNVECATKCTTNTDCITNFCNPRTNKCEPEAPVIRGSVQRCQSNNECASGYCVEGLCCDSACTEKCKSCTLPSSPGECKQVPVGMDVKGQCSNGACQSTCDDKGECSESAVGTGSLCSKSQCTSRSKGVGAGYCSSKNGQCEYEHTGVFDCGVYACEEALGACYVQCRSDDQCAENYVCDVNSRKCITAPSPAKSGCSIQHASKLSTINTAFYAIVGSLFLFAQRRRKKRQNKF